jgi:hypothetical protein
LEVHRKQPGGADHLNDQVQAMPGVPRLVRIIDETRAIGFDERDGEVLHVLLGELAVFLVRFVPLGVQDRSPRGPLNELSSDFETIVRLVEELANPLVEIVGRLLPPLEPARIRRDHGDYGKRQTLFSNPAYQRGFERVKIIAFEIRNKILECSSSRNIEFMNDLICYFRNTNFISNE